MNIKKIIAAAMAVAIVGGTAPAAYCCSPVSVITASASDSYENVTKDGFIFSVFTDHAVINGCDETISAELVIPSEINGIPVTEIAKEAFKKNRLITSVVIPDSVKVIGDSAFQDCSNLESAKLPDSLDKWGGRTFADCSNLKSVNIPTGVSEIPGAAFTRTGLTSVTVPENIKSIRTSAFEGCPSLKEAIIPSTISKINSFTFAYSGLTSFTVPDSVESIDSYAFSGCKELETFIYPDTLNDFGQNILNNALWLKNRQEEEPLVMINESVIDGTACEGDVVLPDDTVGIWGIAFRDNTAMTSITIPASVKEISYCSFSKCVALESVTFLNPECKIYNSADTITNAKDEESGSLTFTGTIYGYEGSTAQDYAEKYGYKFESLSGTTTTTTTTTTETTSAPEPTTTSDTSTTATTTTKKPKTTTTTETTTTSDTSTPTTTTTKKPKTTTTTETTTAADTSTTTTETTSNEISFIGVWDIVQSIDAATGEPFDVLEDTTATFTFTDDSKCVYYVNNRSQGQSQTIEYTWTADEKNAGKDKVLILNENNDGVFTFDVNESTISFIDPPENMNYIFRVVRNNGSSDAILGDVNDDGIINAVDASRILVLYAGLSSGEAEATDKDFAVCDINGDKLINAVDASLVLAYYASLAQSPDLTLEAFLEERSK